MILKITASRIGKTILVPISSINYISRDSEGGVLYLVNGGSFSFKESFDDILDQVAGTAKKDTDVASTAITALRKSDNLLRDFLHTMSPDNELTERIRVQLRDNCLVFQKGKSYEKL
jgi:hypothetical protein